MKNIFNRRILILIRIMCIYVYMMCILCNDYVFFMAVPTTSKKTNLRPWKTVKKRKCADRFTVAVTLFMGSLREAIPRDGRADDLEHQVVLGLCEQGKDPVELIEGTRPAVDQHERHHRLPLTVGRTNTNEVHV